MPESDSTSTSVADAKPADPEVKSKTRPVPSRREKLQPKTLPPYHVVLLDDDEHTYEYVIDMLGRLFGYASQRGFQMAKEVDKSGRVIVMTTHKEKAELKRDQIIGFGADPRLSRCKGSMSAIIEPAEG